MEKPICYIPESLTNFYRRPLDNPFVDKQTAIRTILSIYLDYQCLPTEHNDMEPHDPNGLGILEMICLKLLMFPQYARHIRDVYSKLPEIYEQIVEKNRSIVSVIDEHFTLEQLENYGL
jgi:hypothetical protein